MNCKYLLILCCITTAILNNIQAQVFGGNPASTKWRQIGNDTFNIIFPSYEIKTAREISSLIEWQSRNNINIGHKVKRVNIVLQPEVAYSNGYVGLGPFRCEFYLMSPIDPFSLGSQQWASNLAIHEYRHVQQYNNFNVGLSKTAGTIFGENGRALFNAMAVPDWFFEGDAVYNETKLSQQGRGRLPLFMNDFATLIKDKKYYSYQKIRNGSYVDYVPNHYALGYILVAYGYEKYGMDFWKNVTHDAAAFKSLIYPFQSSVKKYAGINFSGFVNNAFAYYKNSLSENIDSISLITPNKKNDVVSYQFPVVNKTDITALKTSYKKIPEFVSIDSIRERKITTRSIAYDNYFSDNGHEIVYSSVRPDIRWGNRQYSEVRILDKIKKKETIVKPKTKWFTPDISSTGDSLLVVQNDSVGNSILLLIQRNGNILDTITTNPNTFITNPKFYKNGYFYIERQHDGSMSMHYYNNASNTTETIVSKGNRLLGYPNLQGDTLFFSCSNNGKDELWAYDANSKKTFIVAYYSNGIYGGGKSGNAIVGSIFTSNGMRMAKLNPKWQLVNDINADTLVTLNFKNLNGANSILSQLPIDTSLSEKKYSKLHHPINFHSLQPDWDDPNYTVTLYGENVLNTLQSQLYYNYNRNEQYSSVGFSTMYGGWYLMPVLNISQTFNRNENLSNGNIAKWNELNANAGLRLPLNFSAGKLYRYFTIQSTFNTNYIQWQGNAVQLFQNRTFNYFSNTLSYSMYTQQASQQIYPHFGLSFSTNYRTGISAKANQLLSVGNVYLPGVFPTHSVVINAAYMMRDTLRNYSYSNEFPISRGYNSINYPRMWKLGINYHFPIVYPDFGIGNLVYFLRVRGNVFYDYSSLKSLRYQQTYHLRSTGAEIYFDTKWWNQESVTFGFRYSNMMDNKLVGLGINRWEFILPVGLFR